MIERATNGSKLNDRAVGLAISKPHLNSWKSCSIGIALVLILAFVPLAGQIKSPLYSGEKSNLVVETEEGATVIFSVVVVTRSEDLARGLMHVPFMPLDQGMVFFYVRERNVSMWMKDTNLSLDMWFVSKTGVVSQVVRETQPQSIESIRSEVPVVAVVEVNAGLSELIGVTPGAQLRHKVFSNAESN